MMQTYCRQNGIINLFLFGMGALLFLALPLHAFADADATPPTAPSGVIAGSVPVAQIRLSWTASSDNVGVEGYYVYRNGSMIATVNSTSFTDAGLSGGTYSYTISAYDASGNVSLASPPINASVVIDTTKPSVPSGVSLSASPTSTSATTRVNVTIGWSASTDNVAVAGYQLFRNGVLVNTSGAITGVSYVDQVAPGTYTYTLTAHDTSNNVSDPSSGVSITIHSDNQPPDNPRNFTAVASSSSRVFLSWTSSTDNIIVAGYYLYRENTQIGNTAGNTFTDTTATPGTYSYYALAYDAAGNLSSRSATILVTVYSDTNAPSSAANIVSSQIGPTSVRLSWIASYDDYGVGGYSIYRNNAHIINATSNSYIDSGLTPGTYTYFALSYDTSGNVAPSSSLTSITIATATQEIAPTIPTPQTTIPIPSPAPVSTGSFTAPLSFGSRHAQVKLLQELLVKLGYLGAGNNTGFFGNLTLQALKKFQCEKLAVCTGTSGTTGWGFVGIRTRAALNAAQK